MRSAWLAVALLAAACTGKEDPSVLTFWALGREGEAVGPILQEFETENPGVRVRLQQIPFTAAHEKLLTAIVGRSTPDVAQVGNTWIPELAALKVLEPLDPWFPRFPVLSSKNFFPGIWETNVVDGVVWGIPWYVDTRVLFYRQDLLVAAGFTAPPKTWESWRKAMRALKQKGLCPFAIYLPTDEWAQLVILAMQQGATLVSPKAEPKFSEASFTQALEFYLGLFHEGLAPVVGNAQVGNYYQRFADGWYAMYITGPWNLGEFRRRMPPSVSWSTAPLPAPQENAYPGVSLAGGSSLVVFRRSSKKELAVRLLAYLSQPPVQRRFFQETGDLPSQLAAWEYPELHQDPQAQAFWQQLHRVRPLPLLPESERLMQRLWEVVESGIRGQASAQQVAQQMDQEASWMLEKRRWLLARRKP